MLNWQKERKRQQGDKMEQLSGLVKALEDAHEIIRKETNAPKATIVVAREEKGKKLGHFTTWESWKNQDGEGSHEIFISGEALAKGANEILHILIHEVAHSINHNEGRRDVSGDQYHNKNFKAQARELGLIVPDKSAKGYGYAFTSIDEDAAMAWGEALVRIQDGLNLHALSLKTQGGKTTRNKNGIKTVCNCGEIVRMSQKVLDNCRPMCQTCNGEFIPVEDNE
jgi:predicted SprT family Zn-dependent metalloprotease